jgi:glutathione synthase/RimK-type ligase-like ATP-grasp enzyme
LKRPALIIRDNGSLRSHYDELQEGDVVVGRVSCRPEEEYLLFDLADRGVNLVPSALAQVVCRSKSFQTRIFSGWMPPGTTAIHDIHQLQEVMQRCKIYECGVVTKLDRKNAGMGVHRWNSLEDVFNQASLGGLSFPFVIQPFMADCRDIRVVIIGDFVDSYWRNNPNNFRNNIHFGAKSEPCDLSESQLGICRDVMARGKFPYAHIDLMVTPDAQTFLIEINLRGGIKGAAIDSLEYSQRVKDVQEWMVLGM